MTPDEQLQEYQRLLDRAGLLMTLGLHLAVASVLCAVVGMGALLSKADALVAACGAMCAVTWLFGGIVNKASDRALASAIRLWGRLG